ncbi:MAG: hypothetical protein GKS06_00405 [Acidobacteria bacterium]|nr:hypothetical protein [Acidobacteriota bacterium]
MAHWHHLLPLHLVRPVGWTLVHSAWQVALLALALLALLWLLPRRAARIRHAIAVAALVAAIAVPALTGLQLVAATAPPVMPHQGEDGRLTIDAAHIWTNPGTESPAPVEQAASWSDRIAVPLDRAVSWLTVGWIAGVVIGLMHLGIGWIRCRGLVRRSAAALPELTARLDETRTRLGVSRHIALRTTAELQSPALIGWFAPTILMPRATSVLSAGVVDAVLAHEVAHVRRRDYPMNILQTAALRLLFFHPGAHWIARRVAAEREACCDDLAARFCGVAGYARGLAGLEAWRVGVPALGMGDGSVLCRVTRLVDPAFARARRPVHAVVLLALCAFVAGAAVAAVDASSAPTVLGGLDPVRLVGGERVPGDPRLAVEFSGYRYVFADATSRDRFQTDPGRYGVRNAHLCPLTGGQVNPDYFRVVDGQIILFCCDDLVPAATAHAKRRLAEAQQIAAE